MSGSLHEHEATFDGIPGRGEAVVIGRADLTTCKGWIAFDESARGAVVQALHTSVLHRFHGTVVSDGERVRALLVIVTDFVTEKDGQSKVYFSATGLEARAT